jgi:2-dehydro-3-deoxyphosphogluconate aldolase / (4S)-4-hydroxy-2-oxoglutarate aldolase
MLMNTYDRILEEKIVAIIRGAQPEDVLSIALALKKGGVKVLEVTINSPDAINMIAMLSGKVGNDMLVGAGTVLDADTAKEAINAGARFIISPIVNIETIRLTREYGAVSIPGAFTPTEIHTAFASGGQIIKVFPASAGAAYIKDIRGPLPHIPLMPTGGVDLENIKAFHQAGAVAFGIATALVDTSKQMNEARLQQITEKANRYKAAVIV